MTDICEFAAPTRVNLAEPRKLFPSVVLSGKGPGASPGVGRIAVNHYSFRQAPRTEHDVALGDRRWRREGA